MEGWVHADEIYQVNSMYLLPDDAWAYEITPEASDRGRMSLIVLIPDATPDDGPFTPQGATHARVVLEDGDLPWPVLSRFLQSVDSSGDVVDDDQGVVNGDLSLSCNTWRFAGRSFEVNSYHHSDHDCWCYELYETNGANSNNEYLEVRIPDRQPTGGSFAPAAADQVTMRAHGSWPIPWPVLRHFANAISGSGTIIETGTYDSAGTRRRSARLIRGAPRTSSTPPSDARPTLSIQIWPAGSAPGSPSSRSVRCCRVNDGWERRVAGQGLRPSGMGAGWALRIRSGVQ